MVILHDVIFVFPFPAPEISTTRGMSNISIKWICLHFVVNLIYYFYLSFSFIALSNCTSISSLLIWLV